MEFIRLPEYISILKSAAKIFVCLLGVSTLATQVRGVVNDSTTTSTAKSDSPYSSIWLRNVFDLKPTPTVSAEPVKPNDPPPNVHLTGITTILGNKRAMFMVQKKATPGKPTAAEESYILKEGEREGSLEVLEIDTKASTVKIKLEDIISTITFETNKMSSNPGAPPNPGGPPQNFPRPNFAPGMGGNPYPNRSSFPTPTSYSPPPQAAAQPAYASGFGGGYSQPNSSATANPSTPNTSSGTPTSVPPLPSSVQNNLPQLNVTDQERALIAAAQSAISSGNTLGIQSGSPVGNGSVPNASGLSSITIPPIPTTPPPPLNGR